MPIKEANYLLPHSRSITNVYNKVARQHREVLKREEIIIDKDFRDYHLFLYASVASCK